MLGLFMKHPKQSVLTQRLFNCCSLEDFPLLSLNSQRIVTSMGFLKIMQSNSI